MKLLITIVLIAFAVAVSVSHSHAAELTDQNFPADESSSLEGSPIPSVQVPAEPADASIPAAPAVKDLTAIPTSLWQRIRNGFGLPDISSSLVREQEEWYSSRPDYLRRTVERSSRYLYYIVEELEKRSMPTEIALLPIIESAYNPTAYSRAHASGIWQFIPETGKRYGLQQNFWYDGRRDVMAATTAALDYLEKLYEMFGSWDLALASYNWGENAVARAIAKNGARGLATDYRSLTMPRETQYYVPKLQAVKNIVADPARYGIDLLEVPNQPYFTTVTTDRHMDVKVAAKLAGVSLNEFVSLNPAYSRPVIRANGAQTLLLPADRASAFLANLENCDEPLASWHTYTLKNGDRLDRVAAKYRISVAQLKQVNSITPTRKVGPGSTLLVPAVASADVHLPDLPAPPVATPRPPKGQKGTKYAAVPKTGGKKVVRGASARSVAKSPANKRPALAAKTKSASPASREIVLAQGQKPR
jgi:membrane-bound lytic murein transglycosylase D